MQAGVPSTKAFCPMMDSAYDEWYGTVLSYSHPGMNEFTPLNSLGNRPKGAGLV